jgi:hypothetical protein
MFLMRGVPTGTGGTTVLRFSLWTPFVSFLTIPRDGQGGSFRTSTPQGFRRVFSSGEERVLWKVPVMKMILLSESLPGKGNEGRWIAFRNPFHKSRSSGDVKPMEGWIPGPIRSP